jgi:hypothetical protein
MLGIAAVVVAAMPAVSLAQLGPHGMMRGAYRGMPYGQFCPGRGWGPYGARKAVKNVDEARQVMESYFAPLREGVRTGKIEEKPLYFEVEILGKDGALIDKAIVDKRTGRIRSIY